MKTYYIHVQTPVGIVCIEANCLESVKRWTEFAIEKGYAPVVRLDDQCLAA